MRQPLCLPKSRRIQRHPDHHGSGQRRSSTLSRSLHKTRYISEGPSATISMTEGTPLQISYSFSFMRRGKAAPKHGEEDEAVTTSSAPAPELNSKEAQGVVHPYENSIKTIAVVETVEEFWSIYNFLKRPNDLPTTTDYHFFRGGIKPTWEDAGNTKGGKWIVRLPKGLASRYWEEVILAMIGGQFTGVPDGEICGAVLSVRYSEDILGVWNKTALDRETVDRIRDTLKKILQLPAHANMEYKPHQASMQDRSSFRNTQVWKPKSLEGRSVSQPDTNRRSGSWGEREDRERKPSISSNTSNANTKRGGAETTRSWRS
jgi:translation initiation factor 4E